MAQCLPLEVLVNIFSYVPRDDLAKKVQFVCQRWQLASWDRSLWTSFILSATGDAKKTMDTLALYPRLRILDLFCATVNKDLLRYLSDSCPNLVRLRIFWDAIYSRDEIIMDRPLAQIKELFLCSEQELYLDSQYLHRFFPNLEQLETLGLMFKKDDLIEYLKMTRSSLHTLSIFCSTGDGHCMLPCLSECQKLKKLSLSGLCPDAEDLPVTEAEHLSSISSLTIRYTNVNQGADELSVFKLFPNITELELRGCSQSNTDTLRIVAKNCPRLKKLDLHFLHKWQGDHAVGTDATLKLARCLESLTHLSIHENKFVTDQCVQHIQLIPKLTHLDLYQCDLVTNASLVVICGFDKLQELKFDLKGQNGPPNFSAGLVKNKNIHLMFYHCRDLPWLDRLRQQHIRASLTGKAPRWEC